MKYVPDEAWARNHICHQFIRDICPPERRAEAQQLIDLEKWEELDAMMAEYHDIET